MTSPTTTSTNTLALSDTETERTSTNLPIPNSGETTLSQSASKQQDMEDSKNLSGEITKSERIVFTPNQISYYQSIIDEKNKDLYFSKEAIEHITKQLTSQNKQEYDSSEIQVETQQTQGYRIFVTEESKQNTVEDKPQIVQTSIPQPLQKVIQPQLSTLQEPKPATEERTIKSVRSFQQLHSNQILTTIDEQQSSSSNSPKMTLLSQRQQGTRAIQRQSNLDNAIEQEASFDQNKYYQMELQKIRRKEFQEIKKIKKQFDDSSPFSQKLLISTASSVVATGVAAVTTKNRSVSAVIGLVTFALSFLVQK